MNESFNGGQIEQKRKPEIISLDKLQKLANEAKEGKRMPKKVLLIDGNILNIKNRLGYFFHSDDETISDSTNFGVHRLAGYLKQYKVPVEIIRLMDFNSLEKHAALEKTIRQNDIIGMSALSPSIKEVFEFCKMIKEKYPDKTTIGGSEHFALDYKEILANQKKNGIDLCCTSQGELPLLALSLGVPIDQIGSLAFKQADSKGENKIINTNRFPRLNETENLEVIHPVAALPMKKEWMPMLFPEMQGVFKYCGSTQTGSGCPHKCEFCTNEKFLGNFVSTLKVAKQEIQQLYDQKVDFVFIRNALLNPNPKHLNAFIDFMKEEGQKHEKRMKWFAFMSVVRNLDSQKFKEMAEAGCVMIGVGVEDVIGKREELGKGSNLEAAVEFIDSARQNLLVRALLIMGLPEHYQYSREEIKQKLLEFMKAHPQSNYRLNIWTPIVGTKDFATYEKVLTKDVRKDISAFEEHDTMHSVIDPDKMYEKIGTIPKAKQWVKDPQDWIKLRDEIITEYLNSEEHANLLENIKKENPLFHKIALEFKKISLKAFNSKT